MQHICTRHEIFLIYCHLKKLIFLIFLRPRVGFCVWVIYVDANKLFCESLLEEKKQIKECNIILKIIENNKEKSITEKEN